MHNNNTSNNTQAFISLKYNNLYIVGEESKVSEFHKNNRCLISMLADNNATAVIDVNEMKLNSMALLPANKEYNGGVKAVPESAEITIKLSKEELQNLKRVRSFLGFNNVHETLKELLTEAGKHVVEANIENPLAPTQNIEECKTEPKGKIVKLFSEGAEDKIEKILPFTQNIDCCKANPKETYYCSKEHFLVVREVLLKNLETIFAGGRAYTITGIVDVLVDYTEINLSDTRFWSRRLAKVLGQLRVRKVLKRQKSGNSMYWYLDKSLNNNTLYSLMRIDNMRMSKVEERGSGRVTEDERGSGRVNCVERGSGRVTEDERGSGRVRSHKTLTVVK